MSLRILILIFVFLYFADNVASYEFDETLENPYRDMRLPPWSTWSEIKERYKILVKQHHPDKNKGNGDNTEFIKIQTAFDRIKKSRNHTDDEEDSQRVFHNFMTETITNVVLVLIGGLGVYLAVWLLKKFFDITFRFFMTIVLVFYIIDRLIPHYFASSGEQYVKSMAICLLIHFGPWLFKKFYRIIFPNKQVNDQRKDKKRI